MTTPPQRTALIFPGQGAPAGEWRDAAAALVPELVELAAELAGGDPFDRLGESTEYDQLAVFCASVAALESLGWPEAELCAGHSLGEVTALVAAGGLGVEAGLRVVAARGRAMARAGDGLEPGGMLAVRAGETEVAEVAARHGVGVANLNAPRQTVLSGSRAALERAEAELREAGIRGKLLAVADCFHSPRMAAAAEELARALGPVELGPRRIRVISALTADEMRDPRAQLVAALTGPVRWLDVVARLEAEGVQRYVEVGPGRALGRMVAQTLADPDIATIETTPLPEVAARA